MLIKQTLTLMLLSGVACASCPNGTAEYNGLCADMPPAYIAPSVPDPSVVSDEKPRKEQIREWESGEVKADMPTSLIFKDIELDRQIAEADAEGKKAAGIQ